MSSTNRGAERRADDAYETPEWCVHRLLEDCGLLRDWLPRNEGDDVRWLEPACGTGSLVVAVNEWCLARKRTLPLWFVNDIRDEIRAPLGRRGYPLHGVRIGDFLTDSWPSAKRIDAVLMNPPFSLAGDFVRACLARTAGPVATLLRLGWLSSAERQPLLREQPPDVFVLPNRPSFTGTGTDSADYCWAVWGPADERNRDRGSLRVLALTPKAERLTRPRPTQPAQETAR